MRKRCSLFKKLFRIFLIVLPFYVAGTTTQATEGGVGAYLPGYRDFFSGVVGPKPGSYFRNDFYFYDASVSRTLREGSLNLGLDVFTFADIITANFVFPGKILGGTYAVAVVLPLQDLKLTGQVATPAGNLKKSGEEFHQGDLYLIPLMIGWNKGNFHWNVATTLIAPTGKYDVNDFINTSTNYFSIDPEFGFTWFDPKLGVDLSAFLGYTFNTENMATQYLSGQAFHVDLGFEKIFRSGLRAGAVGYAWVQTTGDSGAGAKLGSFKGQVFGAGPALGYNIKIGSHTLSPTFKYYREFGAKNRLEGNVYDLFLTVDI